MPRFHILPQIVEGPFGGGNQFANALRSKWRQQGLYEEQIANADTLIFNGYPFRDPTLFLRAAHWKNAGNGSRKLIARLDGPIAKGRNNSEADVFDHALYRFCSLVADGMIVQSQWSLNQLRLHEDSPTCPATVIGNAVDSGIFYPVASKNTFENEPKIRIIATSWSSNPLKGYPVYAWLDENLDFTRYSFTIVGRTDYEYKNIALKAPVEQPALAEMLRAHDVYLTASKVESCSNALLEALQCGLPSIAPNTTSYPEYAPSKDLLFDTKEDIPNILARLSERLDAFREEISIPTMEVISNRYAAFCKSLPAGGAVDLRTLQKDLQAIGVLASRFDAIKSKLARFGIGV